MHCHYLTNPFHNRYESLTHWGRVTHIYVGKLTIIGSDNGLSPDRRQAIIWTNAGILLIRTLGINFSETLSEIHTFSFKKMYLKMSSGKRRPFCLGLNVLRHEPLWFMLKPSCYLNQYWTSIIGFIWNKLQVNFNWDTNTFFDKHMKIMPAKCWSFCSGINVSSREVLRRR